eukprot:PhM_4_TR4159/c2_g1_i2/m.73943
MGYTAISKVAALACSASVRRVCEGLTSRWSCTSSCEWVAPRSGASTPLRLERVSAPIAIEESHDTVDDGSRCSTLSELCSHDSEKLPSYAQRLLHALPPNVVHSSRQLVELQHIVKTLFSTS